MPNNQPLVTIITATYNADKYLEETIQSVLNQTYKNIEYIIIDGGSKDKTTDIIKNHEEKISYWISEKDRGIYDAWNKGLKKVKGDWVAFLGADDVLLPEAIEKYIQKVNSSPREIEYISSKVTLCDNDKNPIRVKGNLWDWKVFKRYMNVAHVGSLHHKSLFENGNNFSLEYKISSDYEFLLRRKQKLKAAFLDEITAYMRVGGVSSGNINKMLWDVCRIKLKHKTRNKLLIYIDFVTAVLKMNLKNFIRF